MTGTVADLEIEDEFTTILPSATIQDAARNLRDNSVAFVVVWDGENTKQPMGILSDRIIIEEVVAEGRSVTSTTVEDAMKKDPPIVKKADTVTHCLELLSEHNLPCLPVCDGGKLVGVVTLSDVMGAGVVWDIDEEGLEEGH